jgi:hypothetical protein
MDAIDVLRHFKFKEQELEGHEVISDSVVPGCSADLLPTIRMACLVYHDTHPLAPDFETCDDYQVRLDLLGQTSS